jgi:ABC-type multidrug transport system fused ATPase/permease subunit
VIGLARHDAVRRLLVSSLTSRRYEWSRLAAWSLVEALPAFFSGRLMARAIDHGFLARDQATGFAWLGAFGVSIVVGAWGTRQTYRWLAAIVEPFRDQLTKLAVTGALRRSMLPGAAPETAASARLTQQVEVVRETYAGVLFVTQAFVVTTVSALLGLLTLIPAVLVLVVPPLVLGLGLFVALLPLMAAGQRASILADERIAASASTLASGFRDVVAAGGEEVMADTIGEHIDAQARASNRLARLTAGRTLAVAIGGWLPLVLVLVEAGWLRRHGATTGAIVGALVYILQAVHPPLQTLVRGLGGTGLWLLVTLSRILEETEAPPVLASNGSAGNGRPALPAVPHDVHFAGVTFRYGPSAEPVVRGLRFTIPDGCHLAVVGPSGAGKSTLANLVAGMLEPDSGELRLGGVALPSLGVEGRVRLRCLIPQQAYVFAGTLRANLAYLNEDASAAEIERAVELLAMRPLVERIGGYDAQVEAAALSAGERQLVTLVRAYISPARLVILDEATCHLDPPTEARVESAFARRPGTLIVIAHRISSAMRAQQILLLDGHRALLGDHDGLLMGSPLYRDLVGHW